MLKRALLFAILLSPLTTSDSTGMQASRPAPLNPGDPAPALRAEIFGQASVFDLAEWRGKVVVVEFWATWCSPCVAAIPHLNDLAQRFSGKGVAFVSVTDDEAGRLTQFLKSRPINGTVIRDATGELFNSYDVTARPRTFIVGTNGRIAGITPYPEEVTEQVLAAVLSGSAAPLPAITPGKANADWDQDDIDWRDGTKPDLQVILKPIRISESTFRYDRGSNHLTADGIALSHLVAVAFSTDPLHMEWATPPRGQYRVSVVVPRGREATLLPLLQSVLSAQFGITPVWETRERDVLVLRRSVTRSPLLPSSSSKHLSWFSNGKCHGEGEPISVLATQLTNYLVKIVVDESALPGNFDWDLRYDPQRPDALVQSLKQVGLELASARRPVRMLIVK